MWILTKADGDEMTYPRHLLHVLNEDLFGEDADHEGFSENEIPDYDIKIITHKGENVMIRRADESGN
jgi:hypothetical protein